MTGLELLERQIARPAYLSSACKETDMAKPATKSVNGTTNNTNNILIEAASSEVNKKPLDRAGFGEITPAFELKVDPLRSTSPV